MRSFEKIRRYLHNPEQFWDAARKRFATMYLGARNRFWPRSVTRVGGPVVSLTTHGERIAAVHLAIESIARGSMLPSRLILWLNDSAAYRKLSPGLRRLQRRGLEIRLSDNYGPHTKYYPYVQDESDFENPLVTADDDLLYPSRWLQTLVVAYMKFPETINCHWARVTKVCDADIEPFANWPTCKTTHQSFRHHALGLSGVIYPPSFLRALKAAGDAFRHSCPRADDIWLHVQGIRSGFRVRQVNARALVVPMLPGSQDNCLWRTNGTGGNDVQARATYRPSDIQILAAEVPDEPMSTRST